MMPPEPMDLGDPPRCVICKAPMDDFEIILGKFCSPECAEHEDRCRECELGPSWCRCEGGPCNYPPAKT